MNAGIFVFPRLGVGAKYGESVSTKILSLSTRETIFLKYEEFLNVIIPLKEI